MNEPMHDVDSASSGFTGNRPEYGFVFRRWPTNYGFFDYPNISSPGGLFLGVCVFLLPIDPT